MRGAGVLVTATRPVLEAPAGPRPSGALGTRLIASSPATRPAFASPSPATRAHAFRLRNARRLHLRRHAHPTLSSVGARAHRAVHDGDEAIRGGFRAHV